MTTGQAQLTQVARAEPFDAFALAALELQFNREQGRAGEAGFLDRYADAWLAERDRRPAWLATSLDGSPVGALMLYVVGGLPKPGRLTRPWAHVTNLYVTRAARRAGVGDQLLRAGLDWCHDNRALWVQSPGTTLAAGLYRRAGFVPAEARLLRLDLA